MSEDGFEARVERHEQLKGTSDVYLSSELWSIVVETLLSLVDEQQAPDHIYVAIHALHGSSTSSQQESIVVRALKCPDTLDKPRASTVLVSPSLLRLHPRLLQAQVRICLTRIARLTNVLLVAEDQPSYELARDDSQRLQQLVDRSILRQGDSLHLEQGNWLVAMVEPVLQGLSDPATTRFTVLPPLDEPSRADDSESSSDVEIDESFLASSIATPQRSLPSSPAAKAPRRPQRRIELNGVSLAHRCHPSTITPEPETDEDEELRVYLRAKELARCGLFSGDWAILEALDSGDRRLVRVFVADDAHDKDHSDALFASPTLLHNLKSKIYTLSSITVAPQFPTAQSVTVARVASPHSVNRIFQTLFLESLKDYFKASARALKKGDIIAVPLCEELARYGETKPEDLEIDLSEARPSAVVYSVITSLELAARQTVAKDPLEDQLQAGHFGCLVDPKVTKLVQTGIERSLVPDAASYLDIPCHDLASLKDGSPEKRLFDYVNSTLQPGIAAFDLRLSVLLKGARGSGKRTLVSSVARRTGFHELDVDCYDLVGETDIKTEGHLRAKIDKAVSCSPCILLLRNIEALARKSQALETGQEPAMTTVLRECFDTLGQGWQSSGFPIVAVATTCDADKVPTGVLGCFKEEIAIEAPAEPERLEILKSLVQNDNVAPDVSLRSLAVQTAALVAADLVDLVNRARAHAFGRVKASSPANAGLTIEDIARAGISLISTDFNVALDKARSSYSESIGAPKIPNVTWDDVGGLAQVKEDILDTIQLPLERPELFADGLKKRSGILLYGPPGTGKTLLAKAVATSCSLNFFSVKGPELLNMYIGESEANVRRVFQRARDAKPCVIFFDELDSVAPKRGNQGDSGGVMDRIVSQLLAELDGMSEGKGGNDVFVIGATNRPDLLDPALLRPGRFDRMLYLGVSDTHDAQLKIIEALTRKFKLDPSTRLDLVASSCPFNYTGADFYALCSDAMLKAMSRVASQVDDRLLELNSRAVRPTEVNGKSVADAPWPLTPQYYLAELATADEIHVLVSQRDFELALAELVPSVSQAEMDHYKTVQAKFSKPKEKDETAMKQQQPRVNGKVSLLPNGSVLKGPIEKAIKPPAHTAKHSKAVAESEDSEEEVVLPKRDKGKGKAVDQDQN